MNTQNFRENSEISAADTWQTVEDLDAKSPITSRNY